MSLEKPLDYDFESEIELKIHNNIDLSEEEQTDQLHQSIEDFAEDKTDLGEISASNNSSFINISWSQTDHKSKDKRAKEACFTQ